VKKLIGILAAGILAVTFSGGAQAQNAPNSKPTIKVCTGPAGGNYQQAVYKLVQQGKERLNMELVDPTNGSLDNIDNLLDGKCDMAPIQGDAWLVRAAKNPQLASTLEKMGPLYYETVHLICNKDAQIGRVTHLRDGKHKVAIGSAGGGSSITWDAFIAADKGYGNVPTVPLSGLRAIEKAKLGDEVSCVLFTAALKSPSMKEADSVSEGKLELIAVDDGDFDGAKDPKTKKPIYNYVDIPSGTYPHLQSGRVHSVEVQAIWIVRTDWIDKNQRAYDELLRAKERAQPDIRQMVGQVAQQ
jgi:TRAP-type uncharacterized transport system substrate-binding protein